MINDRLRGFGSALRELPPPGLDPRATEFVPPMRLHQTSDLIIDPPTGPAEVAATMVDVVACRTAGNNGCDYRVTVTFTESNTLGATIDRVGVRWIERGGNRWWINRDGEFQDVSLVIAADGRATYSFSIFVDSESCPRRIMGGQLRFRYNGTDDEGNSFRGNLTASLERTATTAV